MRNHYCFLILQESKSLIDDLKSEFPEIKFSNQKAYLPNQKFIPNIQEKIYNYKLQHGLLKDKLRDFKNILLSHKTDPFFVAAVIGGSSILGFLIFKLFKKYLFKSQSICLKSSSPLLCLKSQKIQNYKIILNQLKQTRSRLEQLPEPYRTKAIKNIDKQIEKITKKIK